MEVFKAGNIEVSYGNGFLRYFKVGDTEVLRMIYFAVRNANWENWEPVISEEEITSDGTSFRITYVVSYIEKDEVFFQWHVRIQGLEYNEIRFEIVGKALQDFHTNRAGFCILHPIENVAGEPVTVLHSDNEEKVYTFPKWIAPHQPFIDINSMQWKVGENEFRLEMQGDTFETEDQRNWGDASYKTYCTPLHIPFPRKINVGDTILQKVTFKASLFEMQSEKVPQKNVIPNTQFKIGTSAPAAQDISKECFEKLKAMRFDHFHVEIDFSENGWREKFLARASQAAMLGIKVAAALELGSDFQNDFDVFVSFLSGNFLQLKSLTLFSKDELVTSQEVIDHIPEIKSQLGNAKIGIGTKYNFTELNRYRFEPGMADFITLSFDPQEHASDDLTIIENAATVKYMVESLHNMYKKPVHFSPVMLKRRFNPYATDKQQVNLPRDKQTDPRQKIAFLADWTALLLKNLEETDVASVTLYRAFGELGLMDEMGNEYPVYQEIRNYADRNK
ncbi:hypothetical protein [Dyadobacter arcticus]|uniref:ApeA N-terminal domain-containing protein n=1 Tax=Dyadobacter arcticus TaxID=1078754 RepID=A0ABX0ULI8_9BACT|nr:hypothetical protein [Dyadobacter arcticus]NIJ53858.1 hypothetical protein [Dyadobacter arcticus]